jgi:coproporphyrinogen III oxidase-like Fe-S oxidoreductase
MQSTDKNTGMIDANPGGENHRNSRSLKLPSKAVFAERILTAFLKTQTRQLLTLKPTPGISLPQPKPGKNYTLYIHIPFCESLCPYCSFNRFLIEDKKASPYFEALRTEMKMVAALGYDFSSVYIGGGTPTIRINELVKTIDLAKELFNIHEVSCETNPNHLVPEVTDLLKDRVQRLSVGVQSFNSNLLNEMNRLQKFGSGAHILERIQNTAPLFESLNVDMIFNFPNQTSQMLLNDLDTIIQSGAQQVTFYPLMTSSSVEQSLTRSVGKLTHSREWEFYNLINDRLLGEFDALSAWTFVRKSAGMIDEYIVNSEEYVGIGSGSFSYINGMLYVNTFSINEYNQSVSHGESGVNASQVYALHPQMRYWFLMNLFGLDFDPQAFQKRFGVSIFRGLWLEMLFMKIVGAFKGKGSHHLTRLGKYLSVVMMREFFSGVNNVRDIARKSLSPEELMNATPVKNVSGHTYIKTPLDK